MRPEMIPDEALVQRLPLPLAQLYRHAHNAKTPLDRHLTAFYLWEAGLKLLGCTAVVAYAARPDPDPQLVERLRNLARPSLGHWWDFVRSLLPVLADAGTAGFAPLRDLLLGRTRDDFPRAAGLDAALREALTGQAAGRAAVRFTELFDRLVSYRNKEIGHGAAGQRHPDFYEHVGAALLAGATEVLARLDVLAGRRLLYVAGVEQTGGRWLVQGYELVGEAARRVASLDLPREAAARLPDGGHVYLKDPAADGLDGLTALHPLLLYDADAAEVLFLNARRGKRRTDYLGYSSGRSAERADLGGEQRALLARVLGMPVAEGQVLQWTTNSQAEEPPEGGADEPSGARRTLGEFELLSKLGKGGMGVVYRAWQPSLGRQVALKKLLNVGDARTEAPFRREIRALGKVDHPHLVKVFTSGSDGEQWFYAMELVEGAPLSVVCDRLRTPAVGGEGDVDLATWQSAVSTACEEARNQEKPLDDAPIEIAVPATPAEPPAARRVGRDYVRQVVELVRQVAEAAHALHEAGVIHRDVKPGNIMVSADGTRAVLVDLGLAQLADDEEGRLTRTRQFVGTLRYASPQQVLAAGNLDRRTDVYSLGATMWELLALRPLFGATEQTPAPTLMEKVQREEPGRLRKYDPGIPRDLEAIVEKCLQKDAARRYDTSRALAEDLGRFLAGEQVRARPVGPPERLWRWLKRNRAAALAAGLGALVLLLLAAVGALLLAPGKPDRPPSDPDVVAGRLLPVRRRWVVSPREAKVIRFEVEPGQTVTEGLPLVLLFNQQLAVETIQLDQEIVAEERSVQEIKDFLIRPDLPPDRRQDLELKRLEHQAILDTKGRQRELLLQQTDSQKDRPGYFWGKCPGLGAEVPGAQNARWVVLAGDFRDRLTEQTVQPFDHLLGLGVLDGLWEIEVKLSGKHLGQVLHALKSATAKALDIEFWLSDDPGRVYRGKLSDDRITSQVLPGPGGGVESAAIASVDVRAADVPEKERIPDSLLRGGLEVAVRIPNLDRAAPGRAAEQPAAAGRGKGISQTGLVQLQDDAETLVLLREDGLLEKLMVRDGQHVHKDEVLAELRNLDLERKRDEARTQIDVLRKEQEGFERQSNSEDVKDQDRRDRRQRFRTEVEENLGKYKAQIETLDKQLAALKVLAPRDGVVINPPRADDLGKFYDHGRPVPFCTIGDPERLRVLVPLPTPVYRLLKQMLEEGEQPRALSAVIRPEGMGADTWEGKVTAGCLPAGAAKSIPPQLAASSGGPVQTVPGTPAGNYTSQEDQYIVSVVFLKPDAILRPGMLAHVTILDP